MLQNEINDLEKVLARASGAGAQVAFNIAPVDGREPNYDLAQVAMLIVNQVEAAALLRRTDPDAALDSLCAQYPHLQVVLTLGADGLRYGWGEQRLELGAFEVTAVDETAAGDAFVGYLMWAMLAGKPIQESLRIASAAGALAVTRRGAASSVPDQAEVLALL